MVYPPESIIRLPFLKFAKDGKIHSVLEAEKHLGKNFKLSEKIRKQMKKSGPERLFLHKIRWSRTNLKVAKFIRDPKIGHYQITARGLNVLKNPPQVLNDKFLSRYPEYKKWRRKKRSIKKIHRQNIL